MQFIYSKSLISAKQPVLQSTRKSLKCTDTDVCLCNQSSGQAISFLFFLGYRNAESFPQGNPTIDQ